MVTQTETKGTSVGSRLAWIGATVAFAAAAIFGTALWAGRDQGVVFTEEIEPTLDIIVFWGDGCPRCEDERQWLTSVEFQYPDIPIREYEVYYDEYERARFEAYGNEYDFDATNVPVTIIDKRIWIGWTPAIQEDVATAVELLAEGRTPAPGVYGDPKTGTCSEDDPFCVADDKEATIDVPVFGEVSLGDKSLLVSSLIIGFVDGVNPCSLWVISVLLTIVIRTASRRRVLAIGTTFLTVTAGMYALYIAGIYSALSVIGFVGKVQVFVAIVAGVFGAVSLKDYFAFKTGLSFTIKDSAKPGIYQRVRNAAGHRALIPALGATIVLAVAVSIIETPCTGGFPVIWTGMLQAEGVGLAETAVYFLVYMIPFLLDEMIVFGIAVVTMRATKMQEKHGEVLKLVAGVTMLALAGTMVFAPSLMEDPMTALALFAAAFLLAGIIHLVTTAVRSQRELLRVEHDD
ncbi:MAG: hypothetical protein JW722_02625 [Demequinaceae bacterium]|nr:hypothetical protein [Demequinaceae bacterium]